MIRGELFSWIRNRKTVFSIFVTTSKVESKPFPTILVPSQRMKEEFLKNSLKKIKKEIILNFNEEIIGEPEEKDLKELKSELKKIKTEIINKNINSTKTQTNRFLNENYKNIDEKIKNGEYLNIAEYKDDIEQFVQYCLNKCPNGPNRDILIYEFIIKNIMDSSGMLSKTNIDEMERIICDVRFFLPLRLFVSFL